MLNFSARKENGFALSILICSVVLGTFVRVVNLSGGRFLFPDEYRTLKLNINSLFIYLVYKIPIMLLKGVVVYDIVLHSTAFWGVASIILVFLVGKALFNEKTGSYAALIFSVFGYHVYFSRTGYAAVLQTFLLLGGYYLFLLSRNHGYSARKEFASGLLFGSAFLTYAVSYAPIAAFLIMFIVTQRLTGAKTKKIITKSAVWAGGCLLPLAGLEIICRLQLFSMLPGSFYSSLLVYQKETAMYAPKSVLTPLWFFKETFAQGGVWQLGLVILTFVYCIISGALKRDDSLLWLFGFIITGYLIFSSMALLKVHSIFPRKYLFLTPFVCICCAYLLHDLEKKTNEYWIISFLVVFVAFSFLKCNRIIDSTFKITPITTWIKQRRIGKNQIIASLDLYEKGDSSISPSAYGDYRLFFNGKINWNKLKALYQKKKYGYLLISGIGAAARVGYYDKTLKKHKPLMTWPHPYHIHRPWLSNSCNFALYNLEDFFHPKNE
ncbi:MAG: hypothetical protein ACE5GM_10325 [bacterium]